MIGVICHHGLQVTSTLQNVCAKTSCLPPDFLTSDPPPADKPLTSDL